MKDLTTGSVTKHLVSMALPLAAGLMVQTLYYLVDLYFVSGLGNASLAGVSAVGNIAFLVIALVQILNVGCVALVSQAVGRQNQTEANQIFNQALLISLIASLLILLFGVTAGGRYLQFILSDAEAIQQALTYLVWFLPNLALQFVIGAMSAGLRGVGVIKPAMIAQLTSLLVNIVLAPILIAGWLTGYGFGVLGAGLSSSIAAIVGVGILWRHFEQDETYVRVDRHLLKPVGAMWKRIIAIGFPSGAEFILMFIYAGVIYWAIQDFGVNTQAGFALGLRIIQSLFVPALAIAFALPAVVGQNYGAGLTDRVKTCFRQALAILTTITVLLAVLCLYLPEHLLKPFAKNPEMLGVSVVFLSTVAFNFISSGIVFTCSGVFQGLGNTWPSLLSALVRISFFVVPAIWLSHQDDFQIIHLWYASVTSFFVQAVISVLLLRMEFKAKLSA